MPLGNTPKDVGLACNIASVLFSVLMMLMVKWNRKYFALYIQYRLRYILFITLLVNRTLHLIIQGKLNQSELKLGFELAGYDRMNAALRSSSAIVDLLSYIIFALFLFLTMDRYEKLKMVLPKSWMHFWMIIIRYILVLGLSSCSCMQFYQIHENSVNMNKFVATVALAVLGFALVFEYYFTIALVLLSLQAPFLETDSQVSLPSSTRAQRNAMTTKRQRKRQMMLGIAFWSFIIMMIDIGNIFISLLFAFNGRTTSDDPNIWSYEDFRALIGSWLVVRAYSVLKLLDLFLLRLKMIKQEIKHKARCMDEEESAAEESMSLSLLKPIRHLMKFKLLQKSTSTTTDTSGIQATTMDSFSDIPESQRCELHEARSAAKDPQEWTSITTSEIESKSPLKRLHFL